MIILCLTFTRGQSASFTDPAGKNWAAAALSKDNMKMGWGSNIPLSYKPLTTYSPNEIYFPGACLYGHRIQLYLFKWTMKEVHMLPYVSDGIPKTTGKRRLSKIYYIPGRFSWFIWPHAEKNHQESSHQRGNTNVPDITVGGFHFSSQDTIRYESFSSATWKEKSHELY